MWDTKHSNLWIMVKRNMLEEMLNKIHCGDCVEVMKLIPDNSIDCIVTDPPYGIAFMGKEWDKALPDKEAFRQMFRVLKSGGIAFVMSSPRQDVLWRMLQMLEECGFVLKQSFISWIYKTGFPKAYDVSLGIDVKFIREEFQKQYGRKPTRKELKKLMKEKRKIIGTNLHVKGRNPRTAGKVISAGATRSLGSDDSITEPYHPSAKKWSGWKSITGLKPALECILMVNKPLSEKTIVDNVLKHGTGAINVDACRIPFQSVEDKEQRKKDDMGTRPNKGQNYGRMGLGYDSGHKQPLPSFRNEGRFPANLLISDKALDTGKITKARRGFRKSTKTHSHTVQFEHKADEVRSDFKDEGDQSRYFDLDAWARHRGFLDVPKASKSERDKGLEFFEDKIPNRYGEMKGTSEHAPNKQHKHKNIHPTVKPIKLMAYLIELGCPKDGVMLDPFVGSGTSCIAAKDLGREWVGIDNKEVYVKISSARLGNVEIVFHKIAINEKREAVEAKSDESNKCSTSSKSINYKSDEGLCLYDGRCPWKSLDCTRCLRKKGCIKGKMNLEKLI